MSASEAARLDRARDRPRIIAVGAGFAGLTLAKSLRRAPVEVLLVDRTNYHLFQPLLYQVATAGLEPGDIAYPIRGVLRRIPNADLRVGTVTGADLAAREVHLADGATLGYDHLVLAAGAVTATFGVPGADEHAFGLKSLSDATRLRAHLITQAERCAADPALLDAGALTTLVVGGGPTGVELAGTIAELRDQVLTRDYPQLPLHRARVVLVELAPHVLTPFDAGLRAHAAQELRARNVELYLDCAVEEVRPDAVELSSGEVIPVGTTVWTAGVEAHPLASALGLAQDRGGRLVVEPDLSVPGHPEVWVAGDLAAARDVRGQLLPQLAPVAQQQARHIAASIGRRNRHEPTATFRYVDKGTMATIGRRAAVAQLPFGIRVRGTLGWLLWLVLHLMTLVGFRNRASVLLNWTWNYLSWEHGARLVAPEAPVEAPRPATGDRRA